MSSEKPLLVVLGATGNQGGSVLSHFLSPSPTPYLLRGVTRDPTSPKAKSLLALGIEMVAGDFNDLSSLDAAFQGASVIFSVTDFWQTFFDPSQRSKASASGQSIGTFSRDLECQQNKNIIDAAAKINTLERFIFSSLPDTKKLSGGKYEHVYHFEGKGMAEEYGRLTYPELWEKTSVLYAGYYLENHFGAMAGLFRPSLNKEKDTLILSLAEPLATTPFPFYSVIDDTGILVHALLQAKSGKKLLGVKEWLSFREFASILAHVLGKSIEFVDQNPSFDVGDPDVEKDHADMVGFCMEFGFDGGKVDKSVVSPTDLGVPVELESVEEWCKKQNWAEVLQVI